MVHRRNQSRPSSERLKGRTGYIERYLDRIRNHKLVAWLAAAVTFLGLGGALGQELIHEAKERLNPPARSSGTRDLVAAWRRADALNDRMIKIARRLNTVLVRGPEWKGLCCLPKPLERDVDGLAAIASAADNLAGFTYVINTKYVRVRRTILVLTRGIREMALGVTREASRSYAEYEGGPYPIGSSGVGPLGNSQDLARLSDHHDAYRAEGIAALTRIADGRIPKPKPLKGWRSIFLPATAQ